MGTSELQPNSSSAGAAPAKRTKLSTVAQLRDVARFGCQDEITEIVVSECASEGIRGDLLVRVLSFPTISASVRVLDVSFNDLEDAFWTSAEWQNAPVLPALTSLNLANNGFTEMSLEVIESVLTQCPSLQQLDLSLNAMGYKLTPTKPSSHDVTHLFYALNAPYTCVEVLDLSCLHISDAQVAMLLECSAVSCSLRRLYLRSNDLTDLAAVAIADAITSHQLQALQVLSLAGNQVGDTGLGALALAIEHMAALETLDVDENLISDAGLQTLFYVVNGLERWFPLRFLHVYRNRESQNQQLVDLIQEKLQEKILETHVTVTSLPTDDTFTMVDSYSLCLTGKRVKTEMLMTSALTDHYVSVALTAIRHCNFTWTTLEELDLSGNGIASAGAWEVGAFLSLLPPKLRRLNLSRNQINDQGVAGLADGLEWNATLEELHLNHNQITDDGAKQLYLKAFMWNLQRRVLMSEGNPLTFESKVTEAAINQACDLRQRFDKEFARLDKLDFVDHRLRHYGAAAIAECLLTCPTVKCTSLNLANNMLGDEGAEEVAKILRGYPPLTKLNVSFNDIGDSGAVALADALRVNATLTSLSLHSSIIGSTVAKPKLTETGLMALVQALERHIALTTVDLRDNVTSAALVAVCVQMLQRNPRIQKFNGSSAAVFLARHEF